MRWELLFADLEALADANDRALVEAEVSDRTRTERAALTLADRLQAHVGATLTLRLVTGERITAGLMDLGADWLLLDDSASLVVPMAAVVGVEGLSRRAAVDADGARLARRIPLTVVLRRLARERVGVLVRLVDGAALTGTLDRVGADHFDLAQHPGDEPRRAAAVRSVCVVPVTAVVLVRTAP